MCKNYENIHKFVTVMSRKLCYLLGVDSYMRCAYQVLEG